MRVLQLKLLPRNGHGSANSAKGTRMTVLEKQSRNGHAREQFQMRALQLKLLPRNGHGSVETVLE